MSNILRISDAASLALHTAVILASKPEKLVSTKELAEILQASEAHLSKVLQRLEKSGIVQATRGPKGGYKLRKNSDQVTLLEVYEAIDGKLSYGNCLLSECICTGDCIMGKLLSDLNKQVKDYLSKTKLNELAERFVKL